MAEAKNITPRQKENKEVKKPNHRYMRDKDREKVRGVFKFYEVPGGSCSFVFKAYKEDPVERYDFVDGEIYTIPLGVAKHLNKNGWYPEYGFIPGDSKTQTAYGASIGGSAPNFMRVAKKVRRFGFQSLEFMDDAELPMTQPVELVTVEQMVV